MSHRLLLVAVLATATVVGGGTPARAAAVNPVAIWQMNEAPGARVMVDSSGHGFHGRLGKEVQTVKVIGGATAYFFPWLEPNTPPPHPEHLVTVPHNAALNPGTRAYAVTFRMMTTHRYGNIIQKGQGGSPGGYFKVQTSKGIVQCGFKGSLGTGGVGSNRAFDDGAWHTIRCERTANAVTLTIDGVVVARKNGPTGTISNDAPLSTAGKANCDDVRVSCDYFSGYLDWVRIDVG